jgi:hypothetical protein
MLKVSHVNDPAGQVFVSGRVEVFCMSSLRLFVCTAVSYCTDFYRQPTKYQIFYSVPDVSGCRPRWTSG